MPKKPEPVALVVTWAHSPGYHTSEGFIIQAKATAQFYQSDRARLTPTTPLCWGMRILMYGKTSVRALRVRIGYVCCTLHNYRNTKCEGIAEAVPREAIHGSVDAMLE